MNTSPHHPIDSLLKAELPQERMRVEAKTQLILSLEQRMHKKLFPRLLLLLPASGILTISLFAIISYNIPQYKDSRVFGNTSATPFYIADQWARDHVHYRFADSLTLPETLIAPQSTFIPFDRSSLDPIAAAINPGFLENVTTESDDIVYHAGEQYLRFGQEQHNPTTHELLPDVQFEYQLFAMPSSREEAEAFFKIENVGITKKEQQEIIEAVLTKHPALTLGHAYTIEQTRPYTSIVRLNIGANQSVEAYDFEFRAGKIFRIRGQALSSLSTYSTTEYGSMDSILADINTNPPFFIGGMTADVDVDFMFTQYRFTNAGLELYYQLMSPQDTYAALGIQNGPESIMGFTGEWMLIAPAAERAARLKEIENYTDSN